jgi:dTDP-4-dehydrorhamnose reductase
MDRLVWITGAGGLIGHHLARSAPQFAPDWTVRPLTRTDLDLTNTAATQALFAAESPSLVIHCAALTRSPACQQNPDFARRINVDITAHLARLAANIPFFFFSSDLVFDGRKGQYTEDDQPHPLSVYGETKLAAEKCLLSNPRHTVIRTSLTAGTSATGNRSLTETMANAWQLGRTLQLFTDEFRSPLPVNATARATWELVRQAATGLFHLAGAERLSRWEIGQIVAAAFPHLECRVAQSSIHSYRGAPRPADTSLNSARAQALLSFPLPSFRQWTP